MSELHDLAATVQRQLIARGELSCLELTDHYLARIEALNPKLRAFTTVTADTARERAAALDDDQNRGATRSHELPLWGMPFADKDLVDRAGVVTTFGSRALRQNVATASHPLVETMDAAGGVSLGKTNTPEFGFPSYTENQLFVDDESDASKVARNPWQTDLGPGGSSGGAAVAVAARMLPFAPGSDGGGSVRIPAAACGLVGLKPSRGRVPAGAGQESLAGLVVSGPIARSVADAALLFDGMRGHAPHPFATVAPRGEAAYLDILDAPIKPLRIGFNSWSPWATDYRIEVEDEAAIALEQTIRLSERLGHRVEPVEPRPFPEYFAAFRTIWQAGASQVPAAVIESGQVEPLTRWLYERSQEVSAAQLVWALDALARFEQQIIADYAPYDLVLTPAMAMAPRPLGWYDQSDGERNFEQQCQYTPFTSYLNACGLPAISLPVHSSRAAASASVLSGGDAVELPFGVQAIGRPGDERTLLQFGQQLENELQWQLRVPPAAML